MELKDNMGFSDWLDKHASNAEDTAALESVWEMTGSYRQGEEPDVSASFSRLQARLQTPKMAVRPLSPLEEGQGFSK